MLFGLNNLHVYRKFKFFIYIKEIVIKNLLVDIRTTKKIKYRKDYSVRKKDIRHGLYLKDWKELGLNKSKEYCQCLIKEASPSTFFGGIK